MSRGRKKRKMNWREREKVDAELYKQNFWKRKDRENKKRYGIFMRSPSGKLVGMVDMKKGIKLNGMYFSDKIFYHWKVAPSLTSEAIALGCFIICTNREQTDIEIGSHMGSGHFTFEEKK